jgi:hypothetical protein
LGKIKHEMSEESHMDEVVETKPVEEFVEEPAAVVEEVEEVVEEAPVVPKKKRKCSEAQVKALAAARKSKMSKMSSSKKKPVKIERPYETPSAEFSWTKEFCKASLLASLGLASIYVQQRCAQTTPEVVQVEEKKAPQKKPSVKTGGAGKDPFAGDRFLGLFTLLKEY